MAASIVAAGPRQLPERRLAEGGKTQVGSAGSSVLPRGTAAWLDARAVHDHVHVRVDRDGDVARRRGSSPAPPPPASSSAPTRTYTMSVGAFDDQGPFRLVREIFIDRKPDGYAFVGDHERWTEAETFARLTPP